MPKEFTWSETNEGSYAYYGDEELGYVEFYPDWKKYVWNQADGIIMSESCLKEVLAKITRLTGSEEGK